MCEQKQPARTAALQTSSLTKQPGWEPELRNVNIEIPGSFFFSFLPSRQKKKKMCEFFFSIRKIESILSKKLASSNDNFLQ